MNAPVIPPEEWRRAVVAGELRCARLRLLIKAVDLEWAERALTSGYLNADVALELLDRAMDVEEGDA